MIKHENANENSHENAQESLGQENLGKQPRGKNIFGRISKFGSAAFISAQSVRQELESLSSERLQRLASRLGLVRHDAFLEMQAMLHAARESQEALLARVGVLEEKLGIVPMAETKKPSKKKAGKPEKGNPQKPTRHKKSL